MTYGLTFILAASESFLSGKITIDSCLLAILRDVEKARLAMVDDETTVLRMANIDKAITSIPIQHLTSPKLIVGSSSMPSHCHWRPAESSGRELGRVQVVLLQRLQPLHLSGVR